MRTTTITCDICQKVMPQRGWEDEPRALFITTNCTSGNPMARIVEGQHQGNTFKAEDTCRRCMAAIAEAVASEIESLRTRNET